MWPDGTHPILFAESSCDCLPSFRSIAPFSFLVKVPFLVVVLIQKGCGHIDINEMFPW